MCIGERISVELPQGNLSQNNMEIEVITVSKFSGRACFIKVQTVFCIFRFKGEVVNSDYVLCVVKNTGKPLCCFEESAF